MATMATVPALATVTTRHAADAARAAERVAEPAWTAAERAGMSPDGTGSGSSGVDFNNAENGTASFGEAPSAGTGGGDAFNANMFGDALGRHTVQITGTRTFADTVRLTGSGLTDTQYQTSGKDLVTLSSIRSPHSLFGVVVGNPSFVSTSPLVRNPLRHARHE